MLADFPDFYNEYPIDKRQVAMNATIEPHRHWIMVGEYHPRTFAKPLNSSYPRMRVSSFFSGLLDSRLRGNDGKRKS